MKVNQLHKHQIADFCLIIVLATLAIAYFFDAYRASSEILNMILILPVTFLLLTLCLIEFITQYVNCSHVQNEPAELSENDDYKDLEPLSTVAPVIGLFVAYVLTLEWLGFDFGTFLFVSLFLRVHGEKRWLWVIGYSFAFALATSVFFSAMLPYPMPMLILETAY